MLKRISSALIGAFLLASSANALVIPTGSKQDGRIQTVTYSKHNVIKVTAQVGKAVLIQFEEDERLEGDSATLGMGDAEGWNLAVKGNNILFKPLVYQSDTNLIVQTNKRTYIFQLSIDNDTKTPTYALRFNYPDTAKAKANAERQKNKQALDVLKGKHNRIDVVITNDNYWGFGDKWIKPTAIYDDSKFTYFEFNNGKDLPTIYKVMPDGTEALVNKHVKGHTVIVHEVAEEFVIRLGMASLGIQNQGFNAQGQFNQTGASGNDTVRIIKGEN
ncbi:MAG: TrbG/VirB9 family P-type conjugative transfer protein [Crenarchaeota archaeon]|jgi:type IV secretion system protein VirB9|nr:TrbG/VirB9 family P-type conjugative transfer protein [Thermoproteota archaeon]